jgi:hypothetical protein
MLFLLCTDRLEHLVVLVKRARVPLEAGVDHEVAVEEGPLALDVLK